MKPLGLVLFAFTFGALASEAENPWTELPFEDLLQVEVAGASKYRQPLQEAPSAVQIIEREEIRRYGWQTLAEALNALPGVYTLNNRAYDFVGDRGFLLPGDYNTRYLLLLDGQRINDNIFEQATFGHDFPLDMALIERIEYIPGPASSIYGSNAVLGVINVITRSAKSVPAREASFRADSRGWRKLRLSGGQLGDEDTPDIVLSLSQGHAPGRDVSYPGAAGLPTPTGPSLDGMAHGLDRSDLSRLWFSLRQRGLAVSAWAARRDENPSSALYGSNFDDGRLRLVDASYGVAAEYRTALDQEWQLTSRLAFQRMTFDGDYPGRNTSNIPTVFADRVAGEWWSGEVRGVYTGWQQHKIVIGSEFSADQLARQRSFDDFSGTAGAREVHRKQRRLGSYVQDDWHFARNWHLNLGLRRDQFSVGQHLNSPRFGLIWHASDEFTLKLLLGQAYRMPNAYERDYPNRAVQLDNPGLLPERMNTREVVGEWRLGRQVQLTASLFQNRIDRLIQLVNLAGDLNQYQNRESITVQGIELGAQIGQAGGSGLAGSIALNQARSADGLPPENSPHWLAKLRGSRPLLDERLLAALEVNGIGRRYSTWQGSRTTIGQQAIINASLTARKLAPGLEIQLRLTNLTDRRAPQAVGNEAPLPTLPLPGRIGELVVTYAF